MSFACVAVSASRRVVSSSRFTSDEPPRDLLLAGDELVFLREDLLFRRIEFPIPRIEGLFFLLKFLLARAHALLATDERVALVCEGGQFLVGFPAVFLVLGSLSFKGGLTRRVF